MPYELHLIESKKFPDEKDLIYSIKLELTLTNLFLASFIRIALAMSLSWRFSNSFHSVLELWVIISSLGGIAPNRQLTLFNVAVSISEPPSWGENLVMGCRELQRESFFHFSIRRQRVKFQFFRPQTTKRQTNLWSLCRNS